MGSPLLTAVAGLACAHGGSVMVVGANQRVTVLGAPVLCVGDALVVAGCPAVPPCLALEVTAASRVLASGRPVAVAVAATSSPGGGHPAIVSSQQRVLAE